MQTPFSPLAALDSWVRCLPIGIVKRVLVFRIRRLRLVPPSLRRAREQAGEQQGQHQCPECVCPHLSRIATATVVFFFSARKKSGKRSKGTSELSCTSSRTRSEAVKQFNVWGWIRGSRGNWERWCVSLCQLLSSTMNPEMPG